MRGGGWLSSMAARIFLLLLVGVSLAAALAFSISDIERRDAETRARELRLIDRVVDLARVLNRAPPALRADLLGEGPEAARPAPEESHPVAMDAGLTLRLASRLGVAARAQVSLPKTEDCRQPPAAPSPRPNLLGPAMQAPSTQQEPEPGPAGPPPPPDRIRQPPFPDCRKVSFTLGDGQRLQLILPSGPRPPRERLTPFSPVALAVIAATAAFLALLIARLTTAPLRRLSMAASAWGATSTVRRCA